MVAHLNRKIGVNNSLYFALSSPPDEVLSSASLVAAEIKSSFPVDRCFLFHKDNRYTKSLS